MMCSINQDQVLYLKLGHVWLRRLLKIYMQLVDKVAWSQKNVSEDYSSPI